MAQATASTDVAGAFRKRVAEAEAIVDQEVREKDHRGQSDGGDCADVAADPDQRRHEADRVDPDVREQGRPGVRITTEPVVLVGRLPVGLQQEIPDQMGDPKDDGDLCPVHRLRSLS